MCLSLFGCEEKILYNVRIVHCKKPGPGQSASQGALLEALEGTPLFAWQQPAQLINQLFPHFSSGVLVVKSLNQGITDCLLTTMTR